jgi:hypothetical protein
MRPGPISKRAEKNSAVRKLKVVPCKKKYAAERTNDKGKKTKKDVTQNSQAVILTLAYMNSPTAMQMIASCKFDNPSV